MSEMLNTKLGRLPSRITGLKTLAHAVLTSVESVKYAWQYVDS